MKKRTLFILLILTLLITISCDTRNHAAAKDEPEENGKEQSKEVKSILWQPDCDGNIQISTNDSRLLGPNGTSGWKYGHLIEAKMNSIEVKCFKVSGSPAYGYGIIFCVQEDTDPNDPIDDEGDNFYTILIDVQGWCVFGKVLNRKFVQLESWDMSAALVTGYNAPNTIKVKLLTDYTFEITFNGDESSQKTFQDNDTETPRFSGGRYGYIVTLAPDENFPDIPLDVRFKQIYPADIQLITVQKSIRQMSPYDNKLVPIPVANKCQFGSIGLSQIMDRRF